MAHRFEAGRLARLLVSCPDRHGIVAAVSRFLFERGANILSSAQYSTDPEGGRFFLRMEVHFAEGRPPDLDASFAAAVGEPFAMETRFSYPDVRKRVALLCSRYDHCLLDLLWRFRRGELDGDPALVASNHPDLRADAEQFEIPYHHVPVTPETKPDAEEELLRIVRGADLVVLARYMQILSPDFLARVGAPVINIHHSFLPAFVGADPYRRGHERGVKLVGATAHYVTEELDGGPIIEQDVARVTHADDVEALTRIGADIERTVLARAVKWHLEDRVLVDGPRTVVF